MEPSKRDSLVPETTADFAASNKTVESGSRQDTMGKGEEISETLNHEVPDTHSSHLPQGTEECQDPQMPTTENLATNIATLASTAVEKVKEVGSKIAESAANVTKAIEEGDIEPYDSPASLEPGDMDPIAMAVHSGLDQKADATKEDKDNK